MTNDKEVLQGMHDEITAFIEIFQTKLANIESHPRYIAASDEDKNALREVLQGTIDTGIKTRENIEVSLRLCQ